jgi:hypothetical protein
MRAVASKPSFQIKIVFLLAHWAPDGQITTDNLSNVSEANKHVAETRPQSRLSLQISTNTDQRTLRQRDTAPQTRTYTWLS